MDKITGTWYVETLPTTYLSFTYSTMLFFIRTMLILMSLFPLPTMLFSTTYLHIVLGLCRH